MYIMILFQTDILRAVNLTIITVLTILSGHYAILEVLFDID